MRIDRRPEQWLVGAAVLSLSGCYLARLGAGQLGVVLGQRPIADVLADPTTRPDRRRALEFIGEVRRFGVEALGLNAGESYTSLYDTGDGPVSFVVTAAYVDRLEPITWWFPVVGAVAYKGFFSEEDARRERGYLERLGYDTALFPVEAYSTLGWFRDPVLSTMLDDPPEALAELVLHEMTHATVYAAGDTDFNEQLASFVGSAGAEEFFTRGEGAGGARARAVRARRADARRFAAFLREARRMLEAFYRRPGSSADKRRGRAHVFAAIQELFDTARPGFETRTYDGFDPGRLNNAIFLAYGRYHDVEEDFERVSRASGGDLRRVLGTARALAAGGAPRQALREWLAERGEGRAP